MARTNRAAGAAWCAVAVMIATACSDDGDEPQRDEQGNVTESADSADIFDVELGDCVGDFSDADEVTTITVVPCAEEHGQEVFAISEIDDGEFPGDDTFRARAQEDCVTTFGEFVGVAWDNSELDYTWLQPTEESWEEGDRELVCLVFDPAGPVEGSLEGADR